MAYTCQMNSYCSGGGSSPDLGKLFKFKPEEDSFKINKIDLPNKDIDIEALVFKARIRKWVENDKIEVKAIQENSTKASYFFIKANLNCKDNEISVPCLPQDLLKEILIIKTISEKQDVEDREATFVKRKNEHESFCKKNRYAELESIEININIKPIETCINTKNLIDSGAKIFLQATIEPEVNSTWCQIQ